MPLGYVKASRYFKQAIVKLLLLMLVYFLATLNTIDLSIM